VRKYPEATNVLKTLFPDVFKPEVINEDITKNIIFEPSYNRWGGISIEILLKDRMLCIGYIGLDGSIGFIDNNYSVKNITKSIYANYSQIFYKGDKS